MNLREIILMAIFIALAIAGGLVLAQFPNIELVTVVIFLSGLMLGATRGFVVGAVAEFLYSFFNPYGVAAPPLLIAQVISMAFAGVAGGLLRFLVDRHLPPVWLLGVIGFSLTFVFDLLTTVSITLFTGTGIAGFWAAAVLGLYFYIAHQVSNTLIFALLLPVLWRHLRQIPALQTFSLNAPSLHNQPLQPSPSFIVEEKS